MGVGLLVPGGWIGFCGLEECDLFVEFGLLVSGAFVDKGVSKNRGTPKWMVYNGNPY